jgi:hypothetical protein
MMHGETNTWGAYQCYGDPSFSLRASRTRAPEVVFVSPSELCVWLDQHAAGARQRAGQDGSALAELEVRVSQAPAVWWESADLCARAGHAFTELGEFERAIEYYDRVREAERGTAPIAAFEQLASCQVRWAGALLQQTPADVARAVTLLDQAESSLRSLLNLGETSERWSLLGSVLQRRVLLPALDGAARREALNRMSEAYGAAYERSRRSGAPDAYPLGNQIAADIVRSWRTRGIRSTTRALLSQLEQLATEPGTDRTDTFNLSVAADRLLLQALLDRRLDDAARGRIHERFAAALSRGASPGVRLSMRTRFAFFLSLLPTEFPDEGREAMIRQLTWLQEKLLG